ncbi:acyl-homoserine-lactone synthase [Bradyrhizobium sp.]|jgi:acyl homoserine lactone synthase|uniref:acyl-homoserine-lactone synthase n=1 Tax=Bradyrhizobium sp. TaxID=376 RepID=UPI003C1CAB77
MTVLVLSWENAHLHGEAWISHHRLRHQIFVGRQSWDVPTYNSLEYDQFDTPAARYLVWIDDNGQARGVARLLPTTRPYMIKSLWPELLQHSPPETETIWEATRFGCDRSLTPSTRRRVVAELICGCLEFGLANGISQYLGLMPVAVFNHVIMAAGCKVEIQAANFHMGRHDVAAGYIDVTLSSLLEVRLRAGIRQSVLHGSSGDVSQHGSNDGVSRRERAIVDNIAA